MMKIKVCADAVEAAQEAAAWIAAEANSAIAARGRFVLAVSGGRTPWLMMRALALQKIDWKQVHLFQVDERIAPANSSERNLLHLRECLVEHGPLAPEQLHAMPVESPDLDAAAAQYSSALREVAGSPRFWTSSIWAWGRTATPRPWFREIPSWMSPMRTLRSPGPTRAGAA